MLKEILNFLATFFAEKGISTYSEMLFPESHSVVHDGTLAQSWIFDIYCVLLNQNLKTLKKTQILCTS
jgi:hypothetical protein